MEGDLGEEITVRAPTRLQSWPSSGRGGMVTVVDSKELEASGGRTLQEALRQLPGVNLADEQGNSSQQDLSIRGFTASSVTGLPQGLSVFVDGVRVNEPTVEEVNFDLIPLADVERVEIIHGPSAIFGRNTIGGAVNIITRRGDSTPHIDASVQTGSWGSQEVRARASGPVGALDGYLSLREFSEDGWRVAGGAKGAGLFGKLGLRRQDSDVTLSYQVQADNLQEPGALPQSMLVVDPRQNYTPGDYFQPRLQLVTLNLHQRLAPELTIAANGFFRSLDSKQYNANYVSPDTVLNQSVRSFGGTVQLEHQMSIGVVRNQLTAGADVGHNSVHILVDEAPNAQFGTSPETGAPLPSLLSDLTDSQFAIGLFIQDHARIRAGPLAGLGATAALRFDRITHDIVDASPVNPGNATGKMAFDGVVPAAAVTWEFAQKWVASVSYTGGFRAPAFLELTCANPSAPCVGLQAGLAPDPSLAPLHPVRSQSYEVGVSGSPAEGATARLNLFWVEVHDDIYSVATPGSATTVFFQNVGNTRRQGLELRLGYERGILGVDLGYSYLLATFESDLTLATGRTQSGVETVKPGDQLPLNPNHHLDLDGRVSVLPWLVLSAGVLYTGSQYYQGDEANAEAKLPPYLTLQAGAVARWKMWGRWTASLRFVNLLNASYQTFGTFAPDGRFPGNPIVPFLTPGPPLRFTVGLRWELE